MRFKQCTGPLVVLLVALLVLDCKPSADLTRAPAASTAAEMSLSGFAPTARPRWTTRSPSLRGSSVSSGGMMEKGAVGRVQNLGTVLVASTDTVFATTVGHMVFECGFTAAFPARFEGPWLSLTRTQPRVVICDYDAQVTLVHRLIVETAARRVPLMIVHRSETGAAGRAFAPVERVTWLGFPVAPAAFSRVLHDLVATVRHAA